MLYHQVSVLEDIHPTRFRYASKVNLLGILEDTALNKGLSSFSYLDFRVFQIQSHPLKNTATLHAYLTESQLEQSHDQQFLGFAV